MILKSAPPIWPVDVVCETCGAELTVESDLDLWVGGNLGSEEDELRVTVKCPNCGKHTPMTGIIPQWAIDKHIAAFRSQALGG